MVSSPLIHQEISPSPLLFTRNNNLITACAVYISTPQDNRYVLTLFSIYIRLPLAHSLYLHLHTIHNYTVPSSPLYILPPLPGSFICPSQQTLLLQPRLVPLALPLFAIFLSITTTSFVCLFALSFPSHTLSRLP